MEITIQIKQLGKKRPIISKKEIEINNLQKKSQLKDLIVNVVKQQVYQFNSKIDKPEIIPFLMQPDIDNQARIGKVGFNEVFNKEKANEDEAIDNAILSFKDGIYCVFINDKQIEDLDEEIIVNKDAVITFIRLTFLSGSM